MGGWSQRSFDAGRFWDCSFWRCDTRSRLIKLLPLVVESDWIALEEACKEVLSIGEPRAFRGTSNTTRLSMSMAELMPSFYVGMVNDVFEYK